MHGGFAMLCAGAIRSKNTLVSGAVCQEGLVQ